MTTLALDNVSAAIHGRELVCNVTAQLPSGGVTALVGPNGAGKSTVLRLLCGLWRATSGRVLLDDRDLSDLSSAQLARRVAWVPQSVDQRYAFTVGELVAMGRFAHGGEERVGAAVCRALEAVNAAHLVDRLATELSAGERQRVLLARALATDAGALLFDEPTANLDPRHAMQILGLLRDLAAEGRTVALAMHDLGAAMRFADHVVLLCDGAILADGAPDDVLASSWIERAFGVAAEVVTSIDGVRTLVYHPLSS